MTAISDIPIVEPITGNKRHTYYSTPSATETESQKVNQFGYYIPADKASSHQAYYRYIFTRFDYPNGSRSWS